MLTPNLPQEPQQYQPHPSVNKYYSSADGKQFKCLAVYLHEGSLWAHYMDRTSQEEYNSRLEAFLARVTEQPE
jgi:hypothetical protein